MTTITTLPRSLTDTTPPSPAPPPVPDPGERGRLRIDPSVLRKVAAHVADLTPGTRPAPRTVAGIGLGSAGAAVKVAVTGQRVDLRVELALCYPGPVRFTVERLRSRVGEEVRRITGYQVRSIAVTVVALLPEASSHPQ